MMLEFCGHLEGITEFLMVVISCILLCLLSGVFWLRAEVGCKVISGLLLGCVIATLHGNAMLQRRLITDCVGQAVSLSGEVASLPRQSSMADGTPRQRFELRVTQLLPKSCAGPQRILLSYYGDETLVPGEHWQFLSRLKKPWGLANPGSHNLQAWFAQTGIDAVGSVSRAQAQRIAAPAQFSAAHHRLRQRISARIAALPYDREVRAVLQALTVDSSVTLFNKFLMVLMVSLFKLIQINLGVGMQLVVIQI